jgi:glycosyltransferase 2 family protein
MFIPVVTLVSMIPISLNGMGLREYAFVALFTGIGVPAESAVALGLLSSTVIILSSLPGGVVYVFFKSRSDAQAMQAVEADLS